jgi:hypothetical protein
MRANTTALLLTSEMMSALQECYDACTTRLNRPLQNMTEMLDVLEGLAPGHAGGYRRHQRYHQASEEIPKPLQNAGGVWRASRQPNPKLKRIHISRAALTVADGRIQTTVFST